MLVKLAGAGALAWSSRTAWWRLPVSLAYPRLLMYHMVAPKRLDSRLNKWRVSPEAFAQQMAWLAKHDWSVVTMSEMMDQCATKLATKTAVITFDDGFACFFDNVLPVLQHYQFKVTLYLLSQASENHWDAHKDDIRETLLTDAQIETILKSGLCELGVHGATHKNLTELSPQALHDEVATCREVLQRRYGQACDSFAYPFGCYNDHVKDKVNQTGYRSAVAVHNRIYIPSRDDRLAIPRLTMDGRRSGNFDFGLQMSRGRYK